MVGQADISEYLSSSFQALIGRGVADILLLTRNFSVAGQHA